MLCLRSLRKWLDLALMTILFLIILMNHCNLHISLFTAVRPLFFASTMMDCGVLLTIIAVWFFCFSTYQPPSIQSTTLYCLADCLPNLEIAEKHCSGLSLTFPLAPSSLPMILRNLIHMIITCGVPEGCISPSRSMLTLVLPALWPTSKNA